MLREVDNDGSSAFRFLLTPIRIVCANTQAAAIARAKASFAIRHTGGARGAISEARTALGLSWRYIEAFETEAAALYAAPMGVEEVRDFAAELVKVDQAPSAAARNRRREQANSIVKIFVKSRPPEKEHPMNAITVYTKPACVQCNATFRGPGQSRN